MTHFRAGVLTGIGLYFLARFCATGLLPGNYRFDIDWIRLVDHVAAMEVRR